MFRLPLKNSLSEELDINSGCIEPDPGKPSSTIFLGLCFRIMVEYKICNHKYKKTLEYYFHFAVAYFFNLFLKVFMRIFPSDFNTYQPRVEKIKPQGYLLYFFLKNHWLQGLSMPALGVLVFRCWAIAEPLLKGLTSVVSESEPARHHRIWCIYADSGRCLHCFCRSKKNEYVWLCAEEGLASSG